MEAAEDIRRRRATVVNVIRLLGEGEAGRLDEERRRMEGLGRTDGLWRNEHLRGVGWRAEIFAEFEEDREQRRGIWSWWRRN